MLETSNWSRLVQLSFAVNTVANATSAHSRRPAHIRRPCSAPNLWPVVCSLTSRSPMADIKHVTQVYRTLGEPYPNRQRDADAVVDVQMSIALPRCRPNNSIGCA